LILHYCISFTQTGQLRWYAASMGIGLILILAIALGVM